MKNIRWDSMDLMFIDFFFYCSYEQRARYIFNHVLNISTVLEELASIPNTSREIKMITSSKSAACGRNARGTTAQSAQWGTTSVRAFPVNTCLDCSFVDVLLEWNCCNSFPEFPAILCVRHGDKQGSGRTKLRVISSTQRLTSEMLKYV